MSCTAGVHHFSHPLRSCSNMVLTILIKCAVMHNSLTFMFTGISECFSGTEGASELSVSVLCQPKILKI